MSDKAISTPPNAFSFKYTGRHPEGDAMDYTATRDGDMFNITWGDGGVTGTTSYSASCVEYCLKSGIWKMAPKPFEVPASPFYVRSAITGREYRIDVKGLSLTASSMSGVSAFSAETRDIPGMFADGRWVLIDPPAPAVDPVVALTSRVQQLLREKAEASCIVDSAHNALNAAQEKQRDIGKLLVEAQRALDKSMHEAAGVKWDSIRHGPIREIADILADAR